MMLRYSMSCYRHRHPSNTLLRLPTTVREYPTNHAASKILVSSRRVITICPLSKSLRSVSSPSDVIDKRMPQYLQQQLSTIPSSSRAFPVFQPSTSKRVEVVVIIGPTAYYCLELNQ
ncbi:hypothetical protein TNCV_3050641 [Trichonephila clavipes]|nr:hypothetical protein TNCV_3050641 [Trichonephila clavipes]